MIIPITLSEKQNPVQPWINGRTNGKTYINVKAGSIVVIVGPTIIDAHTGEEKYTNEEVILKEDLCVYVENDEIFYAKPGRQP